MAVIQRHVHTAGPDWATAAAVVAAAAAAHHRHDATAAPWSGTAMATHPATAALPPQVGTAWGQNSTVGQQPSSSALPNLNEQVHFKYLYDKICSQTFFRYCLKIGF